jgi:LysM repeat protein
MPGAQITFRFGDEHLDPGARVYSIIRSADGKQGSLLLLCERELRPTDCVYTVGKGDTLTGVAKRFQVPTQELLALNPGVIPNRLRIGQKLRVKEVEK